MYRFNPIPVDLRPGVQRQILHPFSHPGDMPRDFGMKSLACFPKLIRILRAADLRPQFVDPIIQAPPQHLVAKVLGNLAAPHTKN